MPTRFDHTRSKTTRARSLRREATGPEQRLWFHLRAGQMGGYSFRRQHPIGPYYLDFFCAAARLAIELDGGQHGSKEGLAHDAARTRFLGTKGIRVLRFPNHELKEDFQAVLDTIWRVLQEQKRLTMQDVPDF